MPSPTFVTTRPNIFVRDIETSLRFYKDVLSFEVLAHGPGFALLSRDRAGLGLVESHTFVAQSAAVCYLDVEHVAILFEAVEGAGAKIDQVLTSHPWGMRDFVVVDPDGNKIALGERAT